VRSAPMSPDKPARIGHPGLEAGTQCDSRALLTLLSQCGNLKPERNQEISFYE
jgi:hypothetical protein